jgi:hypothetical protein
VVAGQPDPDRARREAAAALAVCTTCPVRDQCLALSRRHWDIGKHGIWGGLVAVDRAQLRRRLPAVHTARRGIAVAQGESATIVSLVPKAPGEGREPAMNRDSCGFT